MVRIVLFLVLIALAAWGAAWVADQPGNVVLTWGGYKITTALPVFALLVGIIIVAAMILLGVLGVLWRTPGRIRRGGHERRIARGRHAITHGLLAIGHGDQAAARQHAETARRIAGHDPLTLLLHAQAAQLDGDREGAKAAFGAMAEREDTRLFGLRGLFIEAQRADDAVAAVMIAEEALRLAPSSTWASHAVLGFRCAQGDWDGALKILDHDLASGLIDKTAYRRRRGVLLTARALELEKVDRDRSRESAMEAVKLAPTLVPAAVLAAKFESEAHQVRRAMRIVEAAWLAHPHPDLADAYAHVRLGDSARQRLVRVETLAAKTPGNIEGALAIARAAIDAAEFAKAREALAPFVADPTQRVAMLMAEIERTEHGDSGKARMWTLRAVRARHDPAWTADGYVSDRWRPVSPVTGRIDAFQWQTPVASLPSSDKAATIESSPFEEAMLAAPSPRREPSASEGLAAPPREAAPEVAAAAATQDNVPPPAGPAETPAEKAAEPATAPPQQAAPAPAVASTSAESVAPAAPAPLFRTRADLPKPASSIPAVIPIVRAPDDPGVDDEGAGDEFVEQIGTPKAQAGGWRGFLARWAG
ncbi:MAG TPA: heme biosynthesis HemY N-terminal domain-containing protein [Bradyrhizobium sp.]|uniref:heme biosynthesis protein HemY n=1 Tax=Bradyrhizobium sp. TaxID=376 RepID=UPI002CAFAEAD|nr:heme biosynthesis HemY N-terminal domain-containing protein [Bradyrhizobium sp.]HLZ05397.1 heme biosynthesis HemY N-terminal domain-containing protein [Bradyrhizobium sp.]